MKESQQQFLDLRLLSALPAPSTYPLTSNTLLTCLQSKFHQECSKFLEQERGFHMCCKAMQEKLSMGIDGWRTVMDEMKNNEDNVKKVSRELNRIVASGHDLAEKEHWMGRLSCVLGMVKHRDVLLRDGPIQQDEYLENLSQVDQLVLELKQWNSDTPIVQQLKEELNTILQQSIKKLLKSTNDPNLLRSLLTQHSTTFLRSEKTASQFLQHLSSSRINHFRLGLNPLLNNINYANNVVELYETIVDRWLELLNQQMELFGEGVDEKVQQVMKAVMEVIVGEVVGKLERNVYKVKDLVSITRIRFCLSRLKATLDENWKSDWEPLPKVLVRTKMLMEEKLAEQAEMLQISKYNIHLLTSYLPIRQHLQSIKQSQVQDRNTSQMDWQKPFRSLAHSRDPTKQPKNKSLLIFNLNIWYLYKKVLKEGSMMEQADRTINWCTEVFVKINMDVMKKQYEGKGLVKVVDICSDVFSVKKLLLAEVALLGHETLRRNVGDALRGRFIKEIYVPMLEENKIEGMIRTEEVRQMCKQHKINMNKYGKLAQNIHIYDAATLDQYLI